jgi:Ca2+-binding EF-hand superfamily protein
MSRTIAKKKRFVVCVRNTGYPASLELRKIYQALPDADAEAHHLIRVIDESGEDYLYPETFFRALDLPQAVETALRRATG